MFRIKICGVTRTEDAQAAIAAGADAIGLNFYPRSKRYVSARQARELAHAIEGRALVVGVFVNAAHEEIEQIAEQAPLDAVQLHGDESPEFAGDVRPALPIVRAYRCDAAGLEPLAEWLSACQRPLAGALVDAPASAGVYGGTGHVADWQIVAREKSLIGQTPVFLAGGLTSENVAEAIRCVQPAGVDTASGVESAPGVKDAGKMKAFVEAATAAFSA